MSTPFVQSAGVESVGAVANASVAFPSANTAGNFLAVIIIIYDGGGASRTVTVSDTLLNTYTQAGWSNSTGQAGISYGVYYAKNCKAGANTVKVTGSASVFTTFAIHEYSGVDTTAPFDAYNNAFSSGNTAPSIAVTCSAAGRLLIGGSGQYYGNPQGVGTGCTQRYGNTDYNDQPIITADKGTDGSLPTGSQSISFTYNPASNCDAWVVAIKAAAVTTTPISRTYTDGWSDRAPVSASKSDSWNDRAPISRTRSDVWNIRSLISISKSDTWNNRTLVAVSRTDAWNDRFAVGGQRTHQWNDRSLISLSRSEQWRDLISLSFSRSGRWNVRSLAARTLSDAWNVRAPISRSRSQAWNDRALISRVSSQLWNDRLVISINKLESWKDRALIFANRSQSWLDRYLAGISKSQAWADRAPVRINRSETWIDKYLVTLVRSETWNDASTAVLTQVSRTYADYWNIRLLIGILKSESWSDRAGVASSRLGTWRDRVLTSLLHSHVWNDLIRSGRTGLESWSIRSLVPARGGSESYRVLRGIIIQDKSIYNILKSVSLSKLDLFSVLTKTQRSGLQSWNILNRLLFYRTLTWNDLSNIVQSPDWIFLDPRPSLLFTEGIRSLSFTEGNRSLVFGTGGPNVVTTGIYVIDPTGDPESRVAAFDFSSFPEIKGGQTIQSAAVTATPSGELVLGTPAIVGNQVQVNVSGGIAQHVYYLYCKVVTNLNKKLTCRGILQTVD